MLNRADKKSESDPFGARREKLIAKSKVREIFTPSRPIKVMDLLQGRESNVRRLIEILNTPGQHALLFGDRGVGKSSIANIVRIVCEVHKHFDKKSIFFKTCSSEDTFETILKDPLQAVNVDISIVEGSSAHKEKSAAKISALVANANVESTRENSEKRKHLYTVSSVAELIGKVKGLLIIDEADSIADNQVKKKIAELMKQLSDTDSPFKVMVVGIADTGQKLVDGHKSVQRCLGEVKLERLVTSELRKIIELGQNRILGHRITFDGNVINSIVNISNGYPYFTHLLALKCCEDAIAADKINIRSEDLARATIAAAESAEGALQGTYQFAIRSASVHGDLYRVILLAAARMTKHEFSAKDLRNEICKIYGKDVSQARLSNFYSTLITDCDESILRRVGKGVYCFNDPRFPSFIRIVNGDIDP